uniref:Uncharacterized protein n=1 Tax=Triticum urartu TaxID=4572 RepID=A0A8R7U644_TRIUA
MTKVQGRRRPLCRCRRRVQDCPRIGCIGADQVQVCAVGASITCSATCQSNSLARTLTMCASDPAHLEVINPVKSISVYSGHSQ